jgi:hypothetical protein
MRRSSASIFAGVISLLVVLLASAGIDSGEDPILVEGSG